MFLSRISFYLGLEKLLNTFHKDESVFLVRIGH